MSECAREKEKEKERKREREREREREKEKERERESKWVSENKKNVLEPEERKNIACTQITLFTPFDISGQPTVI